MSTIFGMIGTGDWSSTERPTNYRAGVYKLYPNGGATLTAISGMKKSRKVDDPKFTIFSKMLADQYAAVTGLYTDELTTAVTSSTATTIGMELWAKMSAVAAADFRIGHLVHLSDASFAQNVKVAGKVIAVKINGANSYVKVECKEAVGAGSLDDIDCIDLISNVNSEGAMIPDAINYRPDSNYNYTQIIRTPLSITRTARKTHLRTEDQYQEAKKEALLYHNLAIEGMAIDGIRYEGDGTNGHKERYSEGLIPYLYRMGSEGVITAADYITDYRDDTATTWAAGGEAWFSERLEVLFRYGGDTRLMLCGSGAALGIMQLAKAGGTFQLTAATTAYGLKIVRWITPFGEILIKTAPNFTRKAYRRYAALLLDPSLINWAYIDDTFFKSDTSEREAGQMGYDATKEEYLTEGGFEWRHPQTMMFLDGIGCSGV